MLTDRVKQFHLRNQFPCDESLSLHQNKKELYADGLFKELTDRLDTLAMMIRAEALNQMERGDARLYRAHLILGEVAEQFQAMLDGSDKELTDALADIIFVTIGTAVTYGLPLDEYLKAVADSNDTKDFTNPEYPRGKGPTYEDPKVDHLFGE